MTRLETVAAVVFWTCAALIVYAYAVYPLLIWALARSFGREGRVPADLDDDALPTASLLIAAYNEAAVIEERLRNAMELDYPTGKLEILVGTDGCKDRTAELVRGVAGPNVRLMEFTENRGKATVINELALAAKGTILLPSDANTMNDPQAARRLVRWFGDPKIGAVCGKLALTDAKTGRNVDGLYWKYENFLKRCEGRLGALLGANGAIYAIRKSLHEPIPARTIVDDFVIPLLAKIRTGCVILYDGEAIAHEETAPSVGSEFHRRARIGAGGFQAIGMLWRLLNPLRGWVAFTFVSHKVLRWLCPFFMIGALIAPALLWKHPLYLGLLLAQVVFYLISTVAMLAPAEARLPKLVKLMAMFTSMNAALLVGFWRWLRGRQRANWKRTDRRAEADDKPRPPHIEESRVRENSPP